MNQPYHCSWTGVIGDYHWTFGHSFSIASSWDRQLDLYIVDTTMLYKADDYSSASLEAVVEEPKNVTEPNRFVDDLALHMDLVDTVEPEEGGERRRRNCGKRGTIAEWMSAVDHRYKPTSIPEWMTAVNTYLQEHPFVPPEVTVKQEPVKQESLPWYRKTQLWFQAKWEYLLRWWAL